MVSHLMPDHQVRLVVGGGRRHAASAVIKGSEPVVSLTTG